MPLKKGDNVLVCDLEYQASVVCWKSSQNRIGYDVRCVETNNGAVIPEMFEKKLDSNTKAILIASVQEVNGYRSDIKAFSEFAKKYGCYLIVDGIQEVGALPVDVKELGIDIYCSGGKKWIGNPYGMGFMYVRKELIPLLEPPFYGYRNISFPEKYKLFTYYLEDPVRHPFDDYRIVQSARKYETGGFANYLGAVGLKKAIEVILKIGPDKIYSYIMELNDYLQSNLRALGLNVCSSDEKIHCSSIVSFNLGLEKNTSVREKKLLEFLKEKKNIFVSLRCSTGTGGIRVSFHYYTPKWYIDALLDAIKEYLNTEI